MASPKSEKPSRAERLKERSAARRETERRLLREAIIETATEQLVDEGYEQFSLREVAERTGYTPTTIYRCFKDRDDLLGIVLARGFDRAASELARAGAGRATAREQLLAQAEAYIDFAVANPRLYRVMFMDRPDIGVREGGSLEDDPLFGVLYRAVVRLHAEGNLQGRTVVEACFSIWGLTHGISAIHVATGMTSRMDVRALVRGAMSAMIDGLAKAR